MIEPLNIPYGLCKITFGDTILPAMGSEGIFQATPKYRILNGGAVGNKKNYLLEDYRVSFEVSLEHESYQTLKMHMQTLQEHEHGLFDAPHKVNTNGKILIIHPHAAGESQAFDLCIWDAYLDPETEFKRTFDKEVDKFNVRFIGNRVERHNDYKLVNSYFFIGDWSKVGAVNA